MSSLSGKVRVSRRFQKADPSRFRHRRRRSRLKVTSARRPLHKFSSTWRRRSRDRQGAFTWTGPYGGGKSSLRWRSRSLAGAADKRRRSVAQRAVGVGRGWRDQTLLEERPQASLSRVVGRRRRPEAAILEAAD